MNFDDTPLPGAFVITPEKIHDERGFFARTFCRQAFAEKGLCTELDQCSISYNTKVHTLRGMHYQAEPYGETKIVRCTHGAIYDVIVDINPESPTFKKWFAVELNDQNRKILYIPKGFAHGFITLVANSEVSYQMAGTYNPQAGRGFRYDDPTFNIHWPSEPAVIAQRDETYAAFQTGTQDSPDPQRKK